MLRRLSAQAMQPLILMQSMYQLFPHMAYRNAYRAKQEDMRLEAERVKAELEALKLEREAVSRAEEADRAAEEEARRAKEAQDAAEAQRYNSGMRQPTRFVHPLHRLSRVVKPPKLATGTSVSTAGEKMEACNSDAVGWRAFC